ncbi:hypothetical protein D9Q98_010449 [Chlorella vulgaris]|uniref:Zinc-finger domain-containing protein n=1 Tax=Chlorella vulgaris TaxID=3077 RepID=A0A9D4YYJ0_CHLVU|nr:hypothetical protein D9Q98_010449 [Chlorella vulgaris]
MSLSALELERAERIRANKLRLEQIGLVQNVAQLAASQVETARARRKPTARASSAARKAAGSLPPGRVRRSERVAGIDVPNYNENARLLSVADGDGGSRDRRLLRENVREEIYDVEHLDALGSRQQEWELFVDGYNASGDRIYDKVNGQTCHQCRQKTMGKRTCCSGCQSLQGVLCGDCLFMRYGENVDEATANPEWLCPLCRDICNCSFHRSKSGWAPTGTLYRHAIAEGYASVAHYLVLNNLSDAAKPEALERGICPPELTKQLKEELKEDAVAVAEQVELDAPADTQRSLRTSTAEEVPQLPLSKQKRQRTLFTAASGSKRQKGANAARADHRGLRSTVL